MSALGKRIKQERKRLGMTQEELAAAIGLSSRAQVNRIESGERKVDSLELRRLSEVLDVPMDAFFDENRGNALSLARGDDDRMTQWCLNLLDDIEFAEQEAVSRGWEAASVAG